MKAAGAVWAVMAASQGVVWGQTTAASFFNPLSSQGGIHLTGVSVYSGYYSSGGAGGLGGFEMAVQNPFLTGPSAMTGVAATFGGSKSTEKSTFTWSYSPSYFNLFYGNNQFSNNGSVNHQLAVSGNRKLGSKWTLTASLNGFLANLEQLYFNPSVLSSVASVPTTFDDLAAGMLARKFTDTQLAALLTGAPLEASPQQGYLYGSRMFNAAATLGLSWAASGRTSLSVAATGSRAQAVNGVGTMGGISVNSGSPVFPPMTVAGVSISWSYSLSPRTQIGATVSSTRIFSRLEQGYTSNESVSIGRTMSRRWFLQGQAGIGKLNYSHEIYAAPDSVQYLYGGGLGFKTQAHTVLVSYNKSLGDAYGLGSGSTSSAMGAWTWKRPGATWSVSAGGGYQELNNPTFASTRTWMTNASVAKALSQQFFLSVQYMYFQFPSGLKTDGVYSSENGVNVGLTWAPSQGR